MGFCLPAAKTSRPGELVSNAGRAQCPARRLPAQRLALPDPPGSSPASQRRPPAWELSAGAHTPISSKGGFRRFPDEWQVGLKDLSAEPRECKSEPWIVIKPEALQEKGIF